MWVRKTTQDRRGCATAVAVATLSITVLAAPAGPIAAQEVIELPAEDRPLDAGFEEIYRLGSLDGGGWDTFGSVAGVGFAGAGNLYILDTRAVRIYVVDLQGNLVRQFIGEGEGPGEFGGSYAAALEFAVMRDGRVRHSGLPGNGSSSLHNRGQLPEKDRAQSGRRSANTLVPVCPELRSERRPGRHRLGPR